MTFFLVASTQNFHDLEKSTYSNNSKADKPHGRPKELSAGIRTAELELEMELRARAQEKLRIWSWSQLLLKCWSRACAGASHFKYAGAEQEREPVIAKMLEQS